MKQEEIRPNEVWDEYLAAIKEDLGTFFTDKSTLERVVCPACHSNNSSVAFMKDDFSYEECSDCSSLYLNPRPTEDQLNQFYEEGISGKIWAEKFYPATAEKRREKIWRKRALDVRKKLKREEFSLLDVGCGYGIFLEELEKEFPEAKIVGVEPGNDLQAVCKEKGLNVIHGYSSDLIPEQENAYDMITCFELLEHMHNPDNILEEMYQLLKPGGTLWMTSIGADGFDIQVLYENHKNIYPPAHINIMSYDGMTKMMERVGYKTNIITPGTMDVDIVRNNEHFDKVPRFVKKIYENASEEQLMQFQKLMADMHLSSHFWIYGEK